jgi:FtsZ-binding cell division protein ZapB
LNEKLIAARMKTGNAVRAVALAQTELERLHGDRNAKAEDISDAAQAFRDAEVALNAAIREECAAVLEAEG